MCKPRAPGRSCSPVETCRQFWITVVVVLEPVVVTLEDGRLSVLLELDGQDGASQFRLDSPAQVASHHVNQVRLLNRPISLVQGLERFLVQVRIGSARTRPGRMPFTISEA